VTHPATWAKSRTGQLGEMDQVSVRYATLREARSITGVMKEAAEHRRRIGATTPDDTTPSPGFVSWLIARNECIVASRNMQIVGAMALQWRDELFWPDRNDDAAGYLHWIAVCRAFAGGRVTIPLVAYAEQEAIRLGKRFLRLDCAPAPKLMAVYERLGFEPVDVISVPTLGPDFRSARFERRIGSRPITR